MESGTGLLHPSWRSRRTNSLQVALMFIIFAAHFQCGFSSRNETLVVGAPNGAWNKTQYKTEGGCLLFHSKGAQSYFYYWPEEDPGFDHCCSWDYGVFQNFSYGKYGPALMPSTYYDLGLIDQCLPFWRCWYLFDRMYETNLHNIYCEMTDLRKLYRRRFFNDTLLKRGLLQSALPLIVLSEILVISSIALYWFIWRRRRRSPLNESSDIMIGATKSWLRAMRKTVLLDLTHLCLLAIIGNGLIEAVRRQNAYYPQSKAFYNYGMVYLGLSILAACSSVLHQITSWIAEMDETTAVVASATGQQSVSSGQSISSHQDATKAPAELEKKIGLNDDWKWQPIAAQLAILFCLGGFLTYPQQSGDDIAGAVFGFIVTAAFPWSGLYALKVIVKTVLWLLGRVYRPNIFQPALELCAASATVARQHRGRGAQHGVGVARSDAFVELDKNDEAV